MKPSIHSSPLANSPLTRRDFFKRGSLAAAAVSSFPFVTTTHAAPDDPINVAVIGCGGRGKGAARNVLETGLPNVQIVALADIFEDQVLKAREFFEDVPIDHCFHGFDAYQKAMAVPGVNYVILATPPGFRPMHLEAAVKAGKQVFMEKPVAVDGPGVRSVIASSELAASKGINIAAGTQRRHQANYRETIKRLQDGEIGELTFLRCWWNGNAIWHRGDQGNTEMERQIRNWYHYVWLCGDHIVEQHIHNIDVCNWIMGAHPVRAYGVGGRQALGSKSGHIYDHFSIDFEYDNGVHMFSVCRQITGGDNRVAESAHGTLGTSNPNGTIERRDGRNWKFPGKEVPGQVQEHIDLITSIRTGKYINEGRQVAESTLTAILGREAAYSGKVLTFDQVLNSEYSYMPEKLEWGDAPKWEVAMPGRSIWSEGGGGGRRRQG